MGVRISLPGPLLPALAPHRRPRPARRSAISQGHAVKATCLTCGRLIPASAGSRCLEHKRAVERARDAIPGTPSERGYNGQYSRNRAAVLAASDGWCAWCHKRPATTVDHVVPLAKGGTNDPENGWQAGIMTRATG